MTIKSKAKSRHLLHIFPTFAVGGSQIRFSQLVKLHGSRYRHTVISLDGVQSMAANIPPAMPVELYPFAAQREGKIVQAIDLLDLIKPDVLVSCGTFILKTALGLTSATDNCCAVLWRVGWFCPTAQRQ
jgi:hypothetical protein